MVSQFKKFPSHGFGPLQFGEVEVFARGELNLALLYS
jgi:hypothetical protein